ncbi:MAG: penicillin-binding protein 2 [Arcobacteraceae bacterium]|nr:penicillin-binding protein 2 [Arcobacteraceae bacterium]
MRVKFIIYFVLAISMLLLGRVYFLSIKSNSYYEQLSKQNYIKRFYETSVRGLIKDRNGKYLAVNHLGFSILIKPHLRNYKNTLELEKTCKTIEKYFPNYKYEKLLKKYKQNDSAYKHEFVTVVDWIAYDDFFKFYSIFNLNKNIKIKAASKRHYPYKDVAGHIIGYVNKTTKKDIIKDENAKYYNKKGKSGLEQFYNDKLRGTLGYRDVKVNSLYKEVELLNELKPSQNNDITTTIDIDLQQYIHKLMDKKAGAVIVMDVNNGEILAAGSFPEFDNNLFVTGISTKEWKKIINDFNHPFTNKLTRGLYPPGSVIKMGVALSFMEHDKRHRNFEVYCTGSLPLGQRNFRCWKEKGHKRVGFTKAIRESCDDFFYKGSLKVGINKIAHTLDKFGIGHKTGIDQPSEAYGVNPNKQWKKIKYKQPWYVGETVVSSIGQGFILVTPMQIARYTASLATSSLPTPHLLKEDYLINNTDLNITQKDLKLVQKGMYHVCNVAGGTAVNHIKSKVTVAGKTGTAQVVSIPQSEKKRMKEHELEYFKRSHAWLTTYAPYRNPKYVVTVMVEHGGHGGSAAGNMVSKIYDKLYELGYLSKKDIKRR